MQYLLDNPELIWYLAGGILLLLEILVAGMTGALLFIGIGALLTGAVVHNGLLTTHFLYQLLLCAGFSAALFAVLWRPLRAWQAKKTGPDLSSDIIGSTHVLKRAASRNAPGTIRWSGVTWKAELDATVAAGVIPAGASVVVTRVGAGRMTVKPVEQDPN